MNQTDNHADVESLSWSLETYSRLPPTPALPDMPRFFTLSKDFYRAEMFEAYENLWVYIHNEAKTLFSEAAFAAFSQWLLATLPTFPDQAPKLLAKIETTSEAFLELKKLLPTILHDYNVVKRNVARADLNLAAKINYRCAFLNRVIGVYAQYAIYLLQAREGIRT